MRFLIRLGVVHDLVHAAGDGCGDLGAWSRAGTNVNYRLQRGRAGVKTLAS